MGYRRLADAVRDLEASGQLRRIDVELDPALEIGEIQRRVYRAGGPALLFTRPRGTAFPLLGNLFGTLDRTRYLFRDTLATLEHLATLKLDPAQALRQPLRTLALLPALRHALPSRRAHGPVQAHQIRLSQLPRLVSWPQDGGAFITLPQVYSESPARPGWRQSNLGMYRIQLSGGAYQADREAGLHYQLHRGIGNHHAEARDRGTRLPVNVFVGGPPCLALAAVMPLPEGMPELSFAGLLGGHRIPLVTASNGLPMPAEADFVLVGHVDPQRTLPEGPFGDHLGYYSLVHDFPVLEIEQVLHRPGAIWPFTTVGRPPQEDTSFGAFIHELTGALIPAVLPGVAAVHAVDAAGVHPLLLALGSERYLPYEDDRQPRELLTQAHAILGQGQLSLAKYLLIAAREDAPALDLHDISGFFRHLLERVDWRRDLHFETRTTIDTLDYSGTGLNAGSKVVIAAAGSSRRTLARELPSSLVLPEGWGEPRLALPGVMVVQGGPFAGERGRPDPVLEEGLRQADEAGMCGEGIPLVVLVDDSEFAARSLDNFLWVTFTRSDPAVDLYGVGSFVQARHWGCRGALVIDARSKPHHAPVLEMTPAVARRIDDLAAAGGPLHGLY